MNEQMPEVISLSKGRFKTTLEHYPQFKKELTLLKKEDPSGNLKYLHWQAKQLVRGECADEIVSFTKQFHTQNAKLKEKDLNRYETFGDLRAAFEVLSKKEEIKLAAQDAEKIYEDERYIVIFPKTKEASQKYGRDTQWCISATKDKNEFNDLISHSHCVFYFIIDRAREKHDKLHKLALVYERDEYYNALLVDVRNTNNKLLSIKKALSSVKDNKVKSEIKTAIEKHLLSKPKIEYLEKLKKAQDTNSSAEILTTLASDKDAYIRQLVAQNKSTPIETFTTLAKDKDTNVKGALARMKRTTAEMLIMLARDKNVWVKRCVAENKNTPAEAFIALTEDEDIDIRCAVAENTSVTEEVLLALAKDEDNYVRYAVAENTSAPATALLILVKDDDEDIRCVVAKNISAPAEVLAILARDKNDAIRFYALQRFQSMNEVRPAQ